METLHNLALTVPEAHKIEDLLVGAIEDIVSPYFGNLPEDLEDLENITFLQKLLDKIETAVLEV